MGNKLVERDVTLAIMKQKQVIVGNKSIDLTRLLNHYENKEYRKDDIDKISLNKEKQNIEKCKFIITPYGSGDTPFDLQFKDKKVCILNFASSKHAGGGFMTGAYAQEEDLCYHSNLYKALSDCEKFYEENRRNNYLGLYLDGIIYTKDVVFFRKKFKNIEPVLVDVITCAAPNKGVALKNHIKPREIDETMSRRLEQILKVAIDNGAKTLVLGAFGCGVFKNDIEYVAQETKKLLTVKGYHRYFDNIVIPGISQNDRVYKTFSRIFAGVPNLIKA